MNRDPSLRARLPALLASSRGDPLSAGRQPGRAAHLLDRFGARPFRDRARGTGPPDEALRQYAEDRRRHEKRLDAEIEEPRDGRRRVVRVQGAEQKVARLRGLKRDVRRFLVAYFANEDHVWILTQDRPQASRECHASPRVDLDLVHPRELKLDRVFQGDDVVGRGLDGVQRGIERGGLSAAGRTRHEDHALRA